MYYYMEPLTKVYMGYRDGISAGKEASAQEGFNIGFKQSASSGYKWGIVRGITSAFVNLPDQFKEKLVKKLEDRDTFQSLYMPVQEISTDDALRMHHFQLLQENKQSHERSKAKFQATTSSAIEDSDCSKLDFLFKELMLLVRESSEIKASVDAVKGEEEE
ncbi:Essential protein Yae1, N terminal [Musa troglodytarum]|uniref:Essential protein Yae1, N terminal n=1 Tax=Musa troglodytarum TaxID=320322 RepID=A0A9E7HGI2_9LILI|nr:Essential protein Yae1, N terminal [Musa troglodytarum]